MAQADQLAVAVIIPTINEAHHMAACLTHLAAFDIAEIVVCDGGSTDATAQIAAQFRNTKVISAGLGRGTQLAAGVAATTSPLIIMLHVDTKLPMHAVADIRTALADQSTIGGCFRLQFDSARRSLRLFAWFSRFETEFTSFGDQAFFMRRHALAAAGGVDFWPLLEDVNMRRRLRRVGRFVKLATAVTTSARRFEQYGVWRCQMRNAFILLALRAGMSPQRLAAIYRATQH